MPRVSIIITCYNLGAFLEEALSSALSQSYDDFEVLLIDDGSTDPATIALLDALPQHPQLRVLRMANQGVARARNTAIEAASGEYILPLDADDRILPAYLERAVPILEQQPEVGFVGCHYRTFGERCDEYKPASYSLPDLLVENVVPIASLFRRSAWQQAGGYCPEVAIEDWDLWLSILEMGCQGKVLPDILFEYRVRIHSRHAANRQAEVYQRTRDMLYQRHRASYERYARDVILGQAELYSAAVAYQHWLEGQTKNLEAAIQEQKQLIEALKTIAERRGEWITQVEAARDYHVAQSNHWQQTAEQYAGLLSQQQSLVQHMSLYDRLKWYVRLSKKVIRPR